MAPSRVWITVSLLLVVSACAAPPVRPAPPPPLPLHTATTPAPRAPGWWKERYVEINRVVRQERPRLLFIGDSITEGWRADGRTVWERSYVPRNAANLGISGDRTEHVLWRLRNGNIAALDPELAVVMIGTNNAERNTPLEIAQGVEAIVRLLRAQLPRTRILLLAIFPRGAEPDDRLRQVNEEVNRLIAPLATDSRVTFLDLGDRFLAPNGGTSPDLFPDLLHPNVEGYRIWADAIEPFVARELGE